MNERLYEDISDLGDIQTILCFQPHPDDTDIMAGGFIAKMVHKGAKVIYVSSTDDRIGTFDPDLWPEKLAKIRRAEQQEAARILGVKELVWLDYRDSEFLPTYEARGRFVELIRRHHPDIVMTVDPWLPYEVHPDHRYTGITAYEACLFAMFPHAYPEHLRNGLQPYRVKAMVFYATHRPNIWIDVSDYINLKLKAIHAHRSQFERGWPSLSEQIKAKMKELGGAKGYEYCETFRILEPEQWHVNIDLE